MEVFFVDVAVFFYSKDDTDLYAIGRKLVASVQPDAVTNHWVCGQWSSTLSIVSVHDIIDLVGIFDTTGGVYVFPRKTALGGFAGWWAKMLRRRRSAGMESMS
ncbi:hypothetical protein CF319_g7215 [Tilletia indica]|nr:hypothetical protein CF319_g7215 [Tilletia indica]